MALTKVGPAGIGSTPGTGYVIGDSFLHSTGLDSTNAKFTGIVTAQTFRVLGNFQVDGTTTTLDTEITSVDKLEVAANNTTVGVAITQSGSGDILNLYDGSTEVFSVADGGSVTITDSIIHSGDENTKIRFPANDTFTVETGGSERLRVTSGGITKVTGQLEVTTGANSFLTSANVFKGTAGQKGVYLRSALSSATTPSYSSVDDTNTGIFFPSADNFGVTTGGTERLRVTGDGRLLVSTNTARVVSTTVNPYLQIEGTNFHQSAISVTRNSADEYGSYLILGKSRAASNGGNVVLQDNDIISEVRFAGSDGNDMVNIAAQIRVEVDGTPQTDQMPGAMIFSTNPGTTGATERLRIDSAGRVSIATTPASWSSFSVLEVKEASIASSGNGDAFFTANAYYDGAWKYKDTGVAKNIYMNTDGIVFRQAASGSSNAALTWIEHLRIKSDGKVGINQNNPLQQLHVSSTASTYIQVQNTGDSVNAYYGVDTASAWAGSSTDHPFKLHTNNTERLRITSDGNILAGRTSDYWSSKAIFQKDQNARTQVLVKNDNNHASASSCIAMNAFGNSWVIDVGSSLKNGNALTFGTDASVSTPTERLRIDSSGHISQGGGTTPASQNGGVGLKYGIKSGANNIIIGETTSSSHNGLIFESRVTGRSGGARASQIRMGIGEITFSTAASGADVTERLRIDSSGRLLVGRTATQNDNIAGVGYANLVQIDGAAVGEGLGVNNTDTARINICRQYAAVNGDDLGHLSFGAGFGGGSSTTTVERSRITGGAEFTNANKYGGNLQFSTCADGSATPTERLRIHSNGKISVGTNSNVLYGNFQVNQNAANDESGIGILANNLGRSMRLYCDDAGNSIINSGDGGGAVLKLNEGAGRVIIGTGGLCFNGDTAATNALDDYEEGSWSPTVVGGSYSVGRAYYIKVGRKVTIFLNVGLSNTNSSAFTVTLPFQGITTGYTGSSQGVECHGSCMLYNAAMVSSTYNVAVYCWNNHASLYASRTGMAWRQLLGNEVGSSIQLTAHYVSVS